MQCDLKKNIMPHLLEYEGIPPQTVTEVSEETLRTKKIETIMNSLPTCPID